MSLISNIAKVAGTASNVLSPVGLASGAAYAVSGGRVGSDITPGYGAQNVGRTQLNNALAGDGHVVGAEGVNQTPMQTLSTNYQTQPTIDTPATRAAAAAQSAAVANEARRVAALRASVGLGQQNALATGQSSSDAYRDSYRLQNQSIVNAYRNAADAYNNGRENAALNLRRGIAGVTQGVRQGLQGAMTSLPDSALDSGASAALGRSWNKLGQQQAGDVYNENALTQRDLDESFNQAQFDRDQSLGNLGVDRNSKVDAISNQLYNDLRTLDINAQGQGVNGAVNYGVRDNLISKAIADLNGLDQQRASDLSGINPLDQNQVLTNAVQLDQAGASTYNPFTLPETTDTAPADVASPVANIPFYTRRRDTAGA